MSLVPGKAGSVAIKSSCTAWKILNGLACVYKPSRMKFSALEKHLRSSLTQDLNLMYTNKLRIEFDKCREKALADPNYQLDYSRHPMVLGPMYEEEDMFVEHVFPLRSRIGGLVIFGINDDENRVDRIRCSQLLRTYKLKLMFGKGTKDGFADGEVVQVTKTQLNRARLAKALAAIESQHQKSSFQTRQIDLKSQEAYELALKGPVRPEEITEDTAVYSISLLPSKEKDVVEIDICCVNESLDFFLLLTQELGMRLRTTAVIDEIRCIRWGFFDLSDALTVPEVNLKSVIENTLITNRLYQKNKHKLKLLTENDESFEDSDNLSHFVPS